MDKESTTSELRKLASIQRIKDLQPIPDADKIEVATVLGWKTVTKKGEFKVGDYCVFFEIDSLLQPKEWNSFLHDKKDPSKPVRLRTVKLRGQVSQGLAIPLSGIPELQGALMGLFPLYPADLEDSNQYDGIDLTKILGVEKWEPQADLNAEERPKANFPFYIKKSDTERVQAYPGIIDEMQGREVYVTIKVDGTSTTIFQMDGEFGVCSRNLELYDTPTSKYWRMARKYDIQNKLFSFGRNISIQGETHGPGVQKNKLGLKELDLAVFDVFDIDGGRYFDYADQQRIVVQLGLVPVQTVFVGKFEWKSVQELIDYASTFNYPNGTPAEGIVIRPTVEAISEVLEGHRMAIKAISPVFLMKYGE